MGTARSAICRLGFSTAVLACAGAGSLAAQRISDPGALGAGDPGRLLETRQPSYLLAAEAPPTHTWSFLGNFVSAIGLTSYGAQAKFANVSLLSNTPFSVAISDKVVNTGSVSHNRIQIDGEIHTPRSLLGDATTLYVTGEYQHTAGVGTKQEYTAQLDRAVVRKRLVVGVIGYYDRSAPLGAATRDGATVGTNVSWSIGNAAEVDAEYDFKSPYNGEDNYVVKLSYDLAATRPAMPRLIVGAGKHSTAMAALRFALK
jgi:hypothetical protein